MTRPRPGDGPVVFDPHEQDTACAVRQTDDSLDQVAVVQTLALFARELDPVDLPGQQPMGDLIRGG